MIHYEMPKEIRRYVLLFQAHLKIQRGNGKFSQQQAISQIIREHKEFVKEGKIKSTESS